MRVIPALAVLLSLLAPAASHAAPACLAPLDKIVGTSPYFKAKMVLHDSSSRSMTLQMKDDPRIVLEFEVQEPKPSTGLSLSEYMSDYEDIINEQVAQSERNSRVETSLYPTEPLAWRSFAKTEVEGVGPSLHGKMLIRFSEGCMLQASFVGPDSPNLGSRWVDMGQALADLRVTAAPFMMSTSWEREDTAPTGLNGLLVGLVAPLLAIGLCFHGLRHLSRLDAPSRNTRIVLGSQAFIVLGLAFLQRDIFAAGLAHLKYTDSLILLLSCAVFSIAALFLQQRATLLALISGVVTGLALVGSSYVGWSPDPFSIGVVGGSLLVISILGFLAWLAPDLLNKR